MWDTFQDGWQTQFNKPTIPITETSFGVVHGDAHNGNIMIEDLGDNAYNQTTIDFDNMQRSWYIVDPGTVIWNANMEMFFHKDADREQKIAQMKAWFLDEYGWDTTEDELKQGCEWRRDFMSTLAGYVRDSLPWTNPQKYQLDLYLLWNKRGVIPVC